MFFTSINLHFLKVKVLPTTAIIQFVNKVLDEWEKKNKVAGLFLMLFDCIDRENLLLEVVKSLGVKGIVLVVILGIILWTRVHNFINIKSAVILQS